MVKKEDDKKNIFLDSINKNTQNPFLKRCKNCTADFWDKLEQQTSELNSKCAPNTYVWIEKFKDDNY